MAYLYITAHADAQQVLLGPPDFEERIAISGADNPSSVINATHYRFVRLVADVPCQLAVGLSPSVSVSAMYMPASSVEVIQVGRGEKIAVRTPLA